MSAVPKFKYLGESRNKVIFEMTLDNDTWYLEMRKVYHSEYPNILPDPWDKYKKKAAEKP